MGTCSDHCSFTRNCFEIASQLTQLTRKSVPFIKRYKDFQRTFQKQKNTDRFSRLWFECKNLSCPSCDSENTKSGFVVFHLNGVSGYDPLEMDCEQSNYMFHICPIFGQETSEDADENFPEEDLFKRVQDLTKDVGDMRVMRLQYLTIRPFVKYRKKPPLHLSKNVLMNHQELVLKVTLRIIDI